MFVSPGQVAEVIRAHPEVLRARLIVVGGAGKESWEADRMTLRAEVSNIAVGLAASLAESMRSITKLRGEVELVPEGTLPNDGKVIEDCRDAPAP